MDGNGMSRKKGKKKRTFTFFGFGERRCNYCRKRYSRKSQKQVKVNIEGERTLFYCSEKCYLTELPLNITIWDREGKPSPPAIKLLGEKK